MDDFLFITILDRDPSSTCSFWSLSCLPERGPGSWADASNSHIKGNQWSLSATSKRHSGKTHEDEVSPAEGTEEVGGGDPELDDGCDLITG